MPAAPDDLTATPSASELDALMRQAWPSLETVEVDGWLVRLSQGVTRRANSAFPLAAPRDLDAALEQVEARYRAAGLPPSFHISEAAQPPGLDALLAARGYALEAPTLVLAASLGAVVAGTAPTTRTPGSAPPAVRVADSPDDAWTAQWWAVDGRGGAQDREVALQVLRASPALYATVQGSHGALAVGRLALAGPWAGLYCLAVDPGCRGRGLGTAVVHALAVAGQARGAAASWLQVVETNAAARRLYERHGFRAVGRYHYRTGPVRPGPSHPR